MESCIYKGYVSHKRLLPIKHFFAYKTFSLLLDLDELDLANKKIAFLGVTFKPNTDDVRESVSIKIINELVLANAKIIAHDPVAIQNAKKHFNLKTKVDFSEDWQSKLSIADAVLILTNWDEYKQLSNSSNQPKLKNKIIIDSRRLFNPTDFPDAKYQTVGRNI